MGVINMPKRLHFNMKVRLRFAKLFLGKSIENVDFIIQSLNNGAAVYDVYLLLINRESCNLMEIISSSQLFKSVYNSKSFVVIGLANGKKEAFELTAEVINSCMLKYGSLNEFKGRFLNGLL